MPLYEYYCTNCGQYTEMLQKVGEKPATTCPNCQQEKLQRQVSATSFQLKGTGWYVTDFKNKNKPEKNKSETDAAKPAGESTKTSEEKS